VSLFSPVSVTRDLCIFRSDIDIVVDSTTVYARTHQKFFYALIAQLEREGIIRFGEAEKVFHARVPIIKIKTIQGKSGMLLPAFTGHLS
jgi:DNA polymerase sigma